MNTFFCRACHEKVCREKLALFGTEKRKSGSIAYRKLQRERGGRLGKGLICTVAVSLLLDPRTNTRSRLTTTLHWRCMRSPALAASMQLATPIHTYLRTHAFVPPSAATAGYRSLRSRERAREERACWWMLPCHSRRPSPPAAPHGPGAHAAAARNENDREIEKWIFEISESVFIRIRFISF